MGNHFVCNLDIGKSMKYYIMLFFLMVCCGLNAQPAKYYSKFGLPTSKDSCFYFIEGEEKSDTLRSYFCSTRTLRSVEPRNDRAIALFYFENQKLRVRKDRSDPLIESVHTWYPDGKKQSEEYYEVNSFSPVMVSYWDSAGIRQITDGDGHCRCIFRAWQQDYLIESGRLVKGKRDSIWVGTLNGRHYFQETYRDGTLLSGISVDEQGNRYTYQEIEKSASPSDGMHGFYNAIGSRLKYPAQARQRNIQGKVLVEFTVEKDGTLSNINVIEGIDDDCDKEAVRAVPRSRKWTPAKQRGQLVRQKMIIPIMFSLG